MNNMRLKNNLDYYNLIDTREIEGSMLVLAKKKIILPKRKLIVEKPIDISSSQYQLDVDDEFGRTSTEIILPR